MKKIYGSYKTNRSILILFGLFFGFISSANAMVVFEEVEFLDGSESETEHFYLKQPGIYELTLTDFEFPVAFESLFLQLTSGNIPGSESSQKLTEVGRLYGPGSFIFQADFAGSYYANIFGITAGEIDVGLFGIQVSMIGNDVSTVPLPPAAILLFPALGLLGMAKKKHRV